MKSVKKMVILLIGGILSVSGSVTSAAATKTRLATVQDAYWDDDDITIARWEEVEDAYQYEIYLYRDDSKVASPKTKKEYINLKSYMKVAGDYYFKVRALAKSSGSYKDGYWSEESDECYISETRAEFNANGGQYNTQGPGTETQAADEAVTEETTAETATDETTAEAATEETAAEAAAAETEAGTETAAVETEAAATGWKQAEDGRWWYQNEDGSWPVSTWWQDSSTGKWYCFDEAGYVRTGWIDSGDVHYYCDADGAMVTGSCVIDGVSYMFDPSGALQGDRVEADAAEEAAAEETTSEETAAEETAETEDEEMSEEAVEETTAAAKDPDYDPYIGYSSSDEDDDD
ncbi:MAG: hypothetical protein LUE86_12065 [Clostridiales bacterium]|nr:hypothetical protein [Clostridiales bacterium]